MAQIINKKTQPDMKAQMGTMSDKILEKVAFIKQYEQGVKSGKLAVSTADWQTVNSIFDSPKGDRVLPRESVGTISPDNVPKNRAIDERLAMAMQRVGRLEGQLNDALQDAKAVLRPWRALSEVKPFLDAPSADADFSGIKKALQVAISDFKKDNAGGRWGKSLKAANDALSAIRAFERIREQLSASQKVKESLGKEVSKPGADAQPISFVGAEQISEQKKYSILLAQLTAAKSNLETLDSIFKGQMPL